ncbi:c-type cytochrome [Derxia gummosa]|uniref:C-type cytochrome n=1 Tax=Derxia gummosa DSM 723 TaxID=1121388 RepID=A0A8B6X8S9_9BURK|nr:c-type cytochrome [Derxia gummosa]
MAVRRNEARAGGLAWSWRGALAAALLAGAAMDCLADAARAPVEQNPRRGDPAAIAAGQAAFNANCARCHGVDAAAFPAGGPDLRRLDAYCRKLDPGPLRETCRRDNDAYFLESVLLGKKRVGIEHMPAWDGVLPRDEIWAIRSWLETRGR